MRFSGLRRSGALSMLLVLGPVAAQATIAPGSAAQIVSLQGSGEQHAQDSSLWLAAKPSQLLPGGAFVRTLPASKMALLFADDTQIRLNQNSVLQVKSLATAAQPTTLMLSLGRAWAQTKRNDGSRLNLETPAATAGIRGTDWELDVDATGKTLLTVLSGRVELSNAQGSVTVNSNEAAIAEVGRIPVKIQLSNPRDRIQWVNALTADPMRHLFADQVPPALKPAHEALRRSDLSAAQAALQASSASAPGDWVAIMRSAQAIQAGDTPLARQTLESLVNAVQGVAPPAYLMLSDLQLVAGEFDMAANTLESGLSRNPQDPELLAQLARVYLLADRLFESAKTLARSRNADTASVLVAEGDLARRQGDASTTVEAYSRAKAVAPGDDRGWFGLGSAQSEREEISPARANLRQALALHPQGVGYAGELGTLETFANRFDAADAAFAAALERNPADYVAWTGLGLLRLKQGQPKVALDAFLRAGVMEPRYARAKAYTAVAYYQLGRAGDAEDTLRQASALDDKDPVPYLLLSQIYTDQFRAGEAVQASREAVKRLPYLKSLNQLASNQKGSANFGASLAFFGLEDWALELAQESYYPYWGGSHLFLADRYAGEFNKNSELFQGYLSDPLAFGASNRFSTLLQRSGHYGAVGYNVDKTFAQLQMPSVTFNGLVNTSVPMAYFAQLQQGSATGFPIDIGAWSDQPAFHDQSGLSDVRARVATLGFGMQPTENLGLFAYTNEFRARIDGHNQFATAAENTVRHSALGLSYRWSPVSQTWFKLGSSEESTDIAAYPVVFGSGGVLGLVAIYAQPYKQFNDLQLRHTVDLSPRTRLSVGVETVKESQRNGTQGEGLIFVAGNGSSTQTETILFGGTNDIDRRFTAVTGAAQHHVTPNLLFDGALALNRITENTVGENLTVLFNSGAVASDSVRTNPTTDQWAPRVGVAFKPAEHISVRAAYQDWVRPLSVSTLNSVETAGIPLEDRLVEAGGRLKRSVVQVGWTAGDATYLTVKADHQEVRNPVSPGVDLRTPALPFLEALRNAQNVNLSSVDVLEDTPDFEQGTVNALSMGMNRLWTSRLSGYFKYTLQDTTSDYADEDAPSGRVTGKRIPYLPRDTVVLGATWASGARAYLGARAVYRSDRFEEKENLTLWPAGWSVDLIGMWETADKHWALGVAALNIGGNKSSRQIERYVVDARYRF
ncbi:MAG: TonB-dependent receptor [Rhodoferax sp.]|nr:TonB-dependent receptor [Rhodoferax sp.]